MKNHIIPPCLPPHVPHSLHAHITHRDVCRQPSLSFFLNSSTSVPRPEKSVSVTSGTQKTATRTLSDRIHLLLSPPTPPAIRHIPTCKHAASRVEKSLIDTLPRVPSLPPSPIHSFIHAMSSRPTAFAEYSQTICAFFLSWASSDRVFSKRSPPGTSTPTILAPPFQLQ